MKKQTLYCFMMILSLSLVSVSQASQVLFEGYYKIVSGGTHIGYIIQKYEFDPNKKTFKAVSYSETGALGGNVTESLVAQCNSKFEPISYEHNSLVAGAPTSIKMFFKGSKMEGSITKSNAPVEKISMEFPKGAFLSTFLGYVMLNAKNGVQVEQKYEYSAVAEEEAKIHSGMAFVKERETVLGLKAFKILNDFKGAKFISYMTEKGEVISVKAPAQNISYELVSQPSEATKGFVVNAKNLKLLFGNTPMGNVHSLKEAEQNQPPIVIEPPKQLPQSPSQAPSQLSQPPVPSDASPKSQGVVPE